MGYTHIYISVCVSIISLLVYKHSILTKLILNLILISNFFISTNFFYLIQFTVFFSCHVSRKKLFFTRTGDFNTSNLLIFIGDKRVVVSNWAALTRVKDPLVKTDLISRARILQFLDQAACAVHRCPIHSHSRYALIISKGFSNSRSGFSRKNSSAVDLSLVYPALC